MMMIINFARTSARDPAPICKVIVFQHIFVIITAIAFNCMIFQGTTLNSMRKYR